VQVKNALLDLQIQQQKNKAITANALPTVAGNGTFTDYIDIPTTLVPAEFFGGAPGTFAAVQFGTKYNANAGISLQQILFDGQVFVGLQARRTSIDYYQKKIEMTTETIKANIYKIYYQLVVSKTQMDQIDANIDLTKKLAHDNKVMNQNGFVEKLELDKSDVQLANLETEKIKLQNTIDNGYLGLKILIGMPVQDSLILTEPITDDQITSVSLDESVYRYEDRKDYQGLLLASKLGEYNIKRYKMSYLPTLSLMGNYSKAAQRTKFDLFGKGDWFTTSYFGLNLSVPIFSGFAKDANVKQAQIEQKQTLNMIDNMKLSIDNDVAKARNDYRTAIATIANQRKNMQLAESVYNQTKKKYDAGLTNSTDLTQTQTQMRLAQSNYINALYGGIIARVDYLTASGQLK
jgi:outer membrane protein TolC